MANSDEQNKAPSGQLAGCAYLLLFVGGWMAIADTLLWIAVGPHSRLPAILGGAFIATGFLTAIALLVRNRPKPPLTALFLAFFGFGAPALRVLFSIFDYGWILLLYAAQHVPSQSARVVGIVAVIIAGGILFSVRLKFRLFYGFTEVAFACFIAWDRLPDVQVSSFVSQSTAQLNASAIAVGLVSSSVYLLVRGFDNIYQARASSRSVVDRLTGAAGALHAPPAPTETAERPAGGS